MSVTTIAVLIEYDPETKTYGATSPDLPDVYAVSDAKDDVLDRFANAATEHLAYLRDTKGVVPTFAIRREALSLAIMKESA